MTTSTRHVLPYPEPGRVLRALVDRPDERERPWVMVAHGFKGFAGWGFFPTLAQRLRDAGMVAVRVDFSGNGVGEDGESFTDDEGFERDTFSRQLEDLDAVRDWVDAGGAGPVADRRGLFGHSRGGGIALIHAAERADHHAVATWAAIDTLDRVDDTTKAQWRERGFLPVPNARTGTVHRIGVGLLHDLEQHRERLDVLAACARANAPTLIVHGTEDPAVSFAAAEHILEALPETLRSHWRAEGSGHTFGAGHPFGTVGPELEAVLQATVGHFTRHLGTRHLGAD